MEKLGVCLLFGRIEPWNRTSRGDRARLRARVEPGALNVGRVWKTAARWHELVEARKRGPNGWKALNFCGGEKMRLYKQLGPDLRTGSMDDLKSSEKDEKLSISLAKTA